MKGSIKNGKNPHSQSVTPLMMMVKRVMTMTVMTMMMKLRMMRMKRRLLMSHGDGC